MRPVNKGAYIADFRQHGDAKPELIARLGPFCSYCEAPAAAQHLDVEHIYSQSAYPGRKLKWRNYLLACSTCNTYKSKYLGNGKQPSLFKRILWPHIDNTFRALQYTPDGRVVPAPSVPAGRAPLAQAAIEMAGLMLTQSIAADYHALGVAYSHIKKREEAWEVAERALDAYAENPSARMTDHILDSCRSTGYFSIWMTVFSAHPAVLIRFVDACKAAPTCFDGVGGAIARGRT